MTDAVLRNWSDLSDDEKAIIKLLYVNGVHSLAQVARIWGLNYNGINQICYKHGWTKEKEQCETSVQQNWLAHTKFMQRVTQMMEVIHQGYEDLMTRHQLADSFDQFPFELYFTFLETYSKLVTSLGGVKPVSQDTHLYLQQNNLQQNNLNVGGQNDVLDSPAVASITNKDAKVMLRKVIENIVLHAKPPQPQEITAQIVAPEDQPDPARGKFR